MTQRYKKNQDTSYTLGITLTIELLLTKAEYVTLVYLHSEFRESEAYDKIISLCKDYKISIVVNDKIFNKLSEKENCYAIGVFHKYESTIDSNQNHLVLVNPSNSGNLGTIIRSMIGFGINQLIIIKPAIDLFNPKVIRASMGSIFHIQFCEYETFNDYQKNHKNRSFYPFMLNGNHVLGDIEILEPFSLIFGNEASGLDHRFIHLGTPIKIMHHHLIDSLNLPIAVSIALYEVTKKSFKKP